MVVVTHKRNWLPLAGFRASTPVAKLPPRIAALNFVPIRVLLLGAWLLGGTQSVQPLSAAGSGARIKDLVDIAGADANQLFGTGLVTGLAGDGDKDPTYTVQAAANLLQANGITLPGGTLSSKNIAFVTVTAKIPPFAKIGSVIDVTVASLGDAKSLNGGVLMQTELRGVNGKTYALAQGPLYVGGFSAGTGGGGGATVQKNHPTAAQIVNGATVVKEIPATIVHDNFLELLLRQPDFTSASVIASAINAKFAASAQALDKTSVRVRLPEGHAAMPVDFIARLEAIEVTTDTPARVIFNERTGTIVATAGVRISHCAVAHGNLTITVASSLDVSQPAPLSQTGATVVTPRTDTKADEKKSKLVAIPELPTVEKVASALNALGVSPRDMMSIFQAMKQAGALQAELIPQ
ncbi:MAG: flagellar basal body P-ring protein FlgI [Verrucomicrobia bacterium]|nr:flagellar basal body P-ring protein FlgI [Verrucomicrobiota bacterium]